MENATKALLIAGSVLIAILLIAVGLKIFNSTSGTTEATKTTMDATAVAVFNNKFVSYLGTNKSKSQAISLLNLIIANNSNPSMHIIEIIYSKDGEPGTSSSDYLQAAKNILNNKVMNDDNNSKYDIVLGNNDNEHTHYEDGAIRMIAIRKK